MWSEDKHCPWDCYRNHSMNTNDAFSYIEVLACYTWKIFAEVSLEAMTCFIDSLCMSGDTWELDTTRLTWYTRIIVDFWQGLALSRTSSLSDESCVWDAANIEVICRHIQNPRRYLLSSVTEFTVPKADEAQVQRVLDCRGSLPGTTTEFLWVFESDTCYL